MVILFIIINIKTTIYATIRGDADQDIKVTAYDAYRALVLSADQNSGASVNADEVVMLDVEKTETCLQMMHI